MPKPGQVVLQLKISLADVRPVVWRRLLVPGGVRLNRLSDMMQAAMGWTNSHLHQFRIGDAIYGMQLDDYPDEEMDETSVAAIDALSGVRVFSYDYDFGDGWEHEVIVEQVTSLSYALKYGVCVDGEHACPPEDVGGPGGYEEFLRVLSDPSDEEFEQLLAWSGGQFDPEDFSLAARNTELQRLSSRVV